MGYGRALLARDVKAEQESLGKRAKKKSLWSSIGRTVGSLGVMAITGGTVNPLTLGLLTGGASFLGGAIGAKASRTGDLSKGKFFKSDRESLQEELGAFGSKNITESLKSGVMAGLGQAAKLQKAKLFGKGAGAGETAKLSEGFGMDFKGSMVGKGMEKRALKKIGKGLVKEGEASLGTAAKTMEVGKGQFITDGKAGMVLPDGTTIGSGRTSFGRGQMPAGGIDRLKSALQEEAIESSKNLSALPLRGQSQWDAYQSGSPIISKVDVGHQIPGVTDAGGPLTDVEQLQYDKLNKVMDRGGDFKRYGDDFHFEGDIKTMGDQNKIKSIGVDSEGNYIVPPDRPNVPLDLGEDAFTTADEKLSGLHGTRLNFDPSKGQDLGFSDFDEASWAEGRKTLSNIDYDIADKYIPWKRNGGSVQSKLRY